MSAEFVPPPLEVHDLTVAYHRKPVLYGVDLEVPAGRLVGIVGPNGAGKSTFIKASMAETGAVFGGEHSGHFYFRDFWRADSGMPAALHTLAALGTQQGPLSALAAGYARYAASGEVNSQVRDQQGRMTAVEQAYTGRAGVEIDHLDGLTVQSADG